jgi:hypothetical protein
MITIFSIPKPFVGNDSIIQQDALRSWKRISGAEILLYGNDGGLREIAETFGCKHISDIPISEYNTPYLDYVFNDAQKRASNDILCYVNSDIILNDIILDAIIIAYGSDFLMTGRRIEIRTGNYQMMYPGMDWFVFPKGMITDMPHFIVGRRGWDNWMVYHCRSRGIPVIDATGFVTAIHPKHDYSHVPGSKGNGWRNCPESDYNLNLLKNRIIYLWELDDATHHFDEDGLLVKKDYSVRDATQNLILETPEWLHGIINPIYRLGHIARWGYLKITVGEV